MFDSAAIKQHFGNAAGRYDENALLQKNVRGALAKLAQKYFPRGAEILDAGCGTGALGAENSPWRLTGIDLAFGMCARTRKYYSAVNADAGALPFADESFGGVFSSLMLQWVDRPLAAFSEMARVIKPGGHMVFSTLAAGTLRELAEAFAVIDKAPHISDFLEAHAVIAAAAQAGFRLVSARQSAVTEYYADAIALMRGLQSIGANNKQQGRRRGLMTPRQFAKLERAYAKTPRGLPATWQVVYAVVQKRG